MHVVQTVEGAPGLHHDSKTERPTSPISAFKEDEIAMVEIKNEGDSDFGQYSHTDSSLRGRYLNE